MVLSADAEIMRWPCLPDGRSEEHTSELQSDQISYAVFCLKKKTSAEQKGVAARPFLEEPPADIVGPVGPGPPPVVESASFVLFFFNERRPTDIYPLSLHDALPI